MGAASVIGDLWQQSTTAGCRDAALGLLKQAMIVDAVRRQRIDDDRRLTFWEAATRT